MPTTPDLIRALAKAAAPAAVELRRTIHRFPEPAYEEHETTNRVAAALKEAGVEPRLRPTKTGLTAEVGTGSKVVAFRADLDALPIDEASGVAFVSEVPGLMHACGHDVHAAVTVGIASVLAQLEDLPGKVRFIFQPAEEAFPGGASDLVRDGVMDGISSIIALHVDPSLETGRFGLKPGPITSSSDRLEIALSGPGGHTARPHASADLIFVAGKITSELPGLLSRAVDPRTPLAIVFGSIKGGLTHNVIPSSVALAGTARTLSRELWDRLPELVEEFVEAIVKPTGAKVRVDYQRGIPPVVNDPHVIEAVEAAISEIAGPGAVTPTHSSMGAEDFSRFLDRAPGALIRLGASARPPSPDLHSSEFTVDEEAVEGGIAAGVAMLIELLRTGPE